MSKEIVKISKEEALKVLAESRKQKVTQFIEESSPRASQVLHEVMDSEDTPAIVRVTAAKDILDRAGFKPVDKLAIAMVQPITGMSFQLDTDANNIQDKK